MTDAWKLEVYKLPKKADRAVRLFTYRRLMAEARRVIAEKNNRLRFPLEA